MAFFPLMLLVCAIVWAWFLVKSKRSLFPPGPYPLPIIGNILQVGWNPNKSLANLSKKYGPLMHLKIGTLNTIVVSSPEMAKLVLQKHDQLLSGRTVPLGAQAYDYAKNTIGFLPVGDKWRTLRKICNERIFSMSRLDTSQGLRQEKLNELRDYVSKCCDECKVVNIGEAAFMTALNLMSATLFSYDFGGFESDSARQVRGRVIGMMEVLGSPNVADFFPFLKAFDPQGFIPRAKVSYGKLIDLFKEIIDKRLASRSTSSLEIKEDFLEELLDICHENESAEFNFDQIKFLILDLFGAGTGTTTTLIEWAMTELLRNPEKMSKLKCEIATVIGEHDQVKESDISRLPYLQAVIKETFRYHPPAALLVPHMAEDDVEINGYTIPKNAQIVVNVWAMGRDSCVWSNPNSFEPERFLESEINYRGQYFELLPFSSGRRMCPGIPLAHRMVHLILASLVHGFDWKLPGGMRPEDIDLSEKFGITLDKRTPLNAVPVKL